jgi:uncharacterized RmlC-like cupin family protein
LTDPARGRKTVRVIREGERVVPDVAQTPGMIREEAVSSEGRWIGVVKAVPDMVSNWHHHGANDTYVYVIQGGLRIEYGPEGKEHAEAGPGDFLHIPRDTVHREASGGTEGAESVVFRVGGGEVLFNVDGPEG